jgi:hypothetical protein
MSPAQADYDALVADWPPLNADQKDRLRTLLQPSGKGLQPIGRADVDTVLDGVREIAEAS